MGIIDEILGTLANVLEISAALSAAIVFFTSREKTEKASKSILAVAEWAVKSGWLDWLKRASTTAYRKFERLYGPRATPKRGNLFGYLTGQSLKVSFRLATIYLVFGAPLLMLGGTIFWEFLNWRSRYFDILLNSALIFSVAFAIAFELRKERRNENSEDKLRDFIISLLFGCFLPTASILCALLLFDQFENDSARRILAGITLFFILLFWHKTIRTLCFSFGALTPIGLILYICASFPLYFQSLYFVSVIAGIFGMDVVGTAQNAKEMYMSTIFFAVFIFSCALYLTSGKKRASHYWPLLVSYAAIWLDLLYGFYRESDLHYFFAIDASGFSIFSTCIMPGTIIAILASVVYANAICDWLSVGLTRYLTLVTANTKKATGYASLILLDLFFAVVFFMMALAIFTWLMHLYLTLSKFPADSFLSGLESAITSSRALITLELPVAKQSQSASASLGMISGNFVRIFAFTAIIPTLFHMAVIVVFALIKLIGRLAYGPARAILQRKEEALSGGEHSIITLHRIIYGGSIFFATSAVLMAGYSLTALFN